MLFLMVTSGSTGRTMLRHGSTSQLARPGEELVIYFPLWIRAPNCLMILNFGLLAYWFCFLRYEELIWSCLVSSIFQLDRRKLSRSSPGLLLDLCVPLYIVRHWSTTWKLGLARDFPWRNWRYRILVANFEGLLLCFRSMSSCLCLMWFSLLKLQLGFCFCLEILWCTLCFLVDNWGFRVWSIYWVMWLVVFYGLSWI